MRGDNTAKVSEEGGLRGEVACRARDFWVERAGRGRGARDRVGRIFFSTGATQLQKNESIHCPRKEAPRATSYPCRLDAPAK